MGDEIDKAYLYQLQFAYGKAVVSGDRRNIYYMVPQLIKVYGYCGLKVNTQKTEYLPI